MLTIITITRNDYRGLSKTLKSTTILRSVSGITQLVVDSSDQPTSRRVRALCLSQAQVKYVYQPRQGIASAFNLGLHHSRSRWLWYLNGGDCYNHHLDHHFFVNILSCSQADLIIFTLHHPKALRPPISKFWPPLANWVPHPASIINRRQLLQLQGFDSQFSAAMDGELWLRLFSTNRQVDLISLPLTSFDPGGISSNQSLISKENVMIYKKHWRLLLRTWLVSGYSQLRFYLENLLSP